MQCPDPAVKETNHQQRSAFGPQQHVRKIQSKQPGGGGALLFKNLRTIE
jgi:hypothetical protein